MSERERERERGGRYRYVRLITPNYYILPLGGHRTCMYVQQKPNNNNNDDNDNDNDNSLFHKVI